MDSHGGRRRPTGFVGSGAGTDRLIRVSVTVLAVSLLTIDAALLSPARPVDASAFPGENGKIAFVKNVAVNPTITLMDADGSNATPLASGAEYYADLAWSPDGQTLAFIAFFGEGAADIYVIDADGTDQTRLTFDGASDPAWSPDGQKLAYTKLIGGGRPVVATMDETGSNEVVLTESIDEAFGPSWSPDGTRITFTSDQGAETYDIFTMAPDGSEVVNLSQSEETNDFKPTWSPDGQRLAFESWPDGGNGFVGITTMSADGSRQTFLGDGEAYEGQPAWSPEGDAIAFVREDEASSSIYTMAPDGSMKAKLTDGVPADFSPAWQPLVPRPARFHAIDPVRILDSRPATSTGGHSTPWGPQQTRTIEVAGNGAVPADADAVVLNVTATHTTASSNLRIWPTGDPLPLVSSLNWQPGWTIANAVTVKIGDLNSIDIYNNNGQTDLVIDIVGYYTPTAGSGYVPAVPSRIVDSRPASNVGPYDTPWGHRQTRTIEVAGNGAVPANADAVVLNITATGTTASSNLRIWPTGDPLPLVSSLNWQPGWTIANAVTVKVGDLDSINIYNNNGQTDLAIDIVGYYTPADGLDFHPLASRRILDSRPETSVGPYDTPWATQSSRPVRVRLVGGVPSTAEAVLLNVTVTDTGASSNLRIWPGEGTAPLVSTLNWRPGWTIANAATALVGNDGRIGIYNHNGNVDVVADVAGWFSPPGAP